MVKAILHQYQKVAIDYIVTRPIAGMFLDMGLGKTLITLTALQILGQYGMIQGHILIIAPKKIAVNTWPEEIDKWDHIRGTSYVQLSGITKKKRDKAYADLKTSINESKAIADGTLNPTERTVPFSIYLINRELIQDLVAHFENDWPFDVLVIDELQSFKGHSSSRFKALMKIRPKVNRIIGLTGTPAPNSLMDLWAQITVLDQGQRLGRNITAYRETYFNPGRTTDAGYPYEWILKYDAEHMIYARISDIVMSMKSIDYIKLPDVTYNTITVKLSKAERQVYKQLQKEHVLELMDGSEITAANAAVLSANLLQLSNGAIYKSPEDKSEVIELHQHKLDALEQIIDSSQGQPIIVFYWFKHDLLRLKKRFPQATEFTGKPETVMAWNDKKIELLLLQPSSSAHGLNLQKGGHIIVWFALPWSLELYLQGNARVARQGQTEPVIIHHIMTSNSMDQKVMAALEQKDVTQSSLLSAVKAQINDDDE